MKAFWISLLLTLVGMGTLVAQIPQVNQCMLPQDYFVNEEFCFTLALQETANTGFGPYLRIILPPGVDLNSATFSNGSTLTYVGAGDTLKDPHRNTGTAGDSLILGAGWSFYILDYPVGSVTANGVSLVTTLCMTMDPSIVTIGVPLNIQFQGGYMLGGTPTGSTGPTLGPLWTGPIVPQLYAYKKTSAPLPRHDRTPGPDWPLVYSLTVDIANAQLVTGLFFQDDLPDSLMYIPGSFVVPSGCTVDTSQIFSGVAGGSFTVSCPSATGTLSSIDVQVRYAGYATNVLDESIGGGVCDSYNIINLSTLTSNNGPAITCNDTVKIYNVTFQQVANPGLIVPGSNVTNTIHIQVSDYIAGMDSFYMAIHVKDGLDYLGNATLDGLPVAPISITNNYPTTGATWVVFDLVALRGGLILPGDSLILEYETQVRQNYQASNAQVLGRDELATLAYGHYHLLDEAPGTAGCDYSYKSTVVVIANSIMKEVVGATTYVPGESITYRLTMTLPSGDANAVVFTDFLPIPIHNVMMIDTVWNGLNITAGPNHYIGAPIPTITRLPANNALRINFGNVFSNSSPQTLEVLITVPVTTIPFANGLIHSNFLEVHSDNTDLLTRADLQLTQITIGAPMLSIVKGVSAVQNPQGWLSAPGSSPVNSNGFGADASDTILFVSTITNVGGANAFNVQIIDPLPAEFLDCEIVSVTNGAGSPYPYTGNLFVGANDTLVIDSMSATGPDSVLMITYGCVVGSMVTPSEFINNTMSVAWASAMGQDSLFDMIQDSALVRVSSPQIRKSVVSITPGHAHNIAEAQVGEVINYVATITLPEGMSDSLTLTDIMGSGLAYAGLDSIVISSIDLFSSLGAIDSIVPTVDSLGWGALNHDRSLVFDFGAITNKNSDNNVAEEIRIYYKARVLNIASNVRGVQLHNDLTARWKMPNGQVVFVPSPTSVVTIVEPSLALDKEFMVNSATPGDSLFVSFELSHTPLSNGNAYDVMITDTLPFGMNFVANSFTGPCPTTLTTFAGGIVTATWDSLELGSTCLLRFKVAVDNAYPSCNDLPNRGNLMWESVYDPFQPALANCPSNPFGVERTGFATSPGQLNNYNTFDIDTLQVGVAFTGIPQITGNAPVCIGNQLELNCTAQMGNNVQYIWTTPQGPDTTTLPQLIIYPTTAADSGYYAVAVSIGGCVSPSSALFLAAITPRPIVVVTGDGRLCEGEDRQLTAVAYPAGNYTYSWIGPNAYISSLQNPLLTNLTWQMTGNYTVQVTGNGCTSAWAAPANIQVMARPIVTTQHDTLACSYGLVDLVVNCTPVTGTGPFSFYWTGPGGFASTMEDAIIPNAMAINQGNYIVTMTDSFGCVSLPITAVVDITDAPQTPVITQQGALCPGDALTLVTTPYAGGSVTYYWVTPNGPVTTSVPSLNIPAVTVNDAGLYSVVAEIDGCQTLRSALSTVVVNAAPVAPNPTATYGDPLYCAGDTLWLAAQGDSAHTYLWSGPNGYTGNGQSGSIAQASPVYNGSYEVTVSNGNCTSIASVTINTILPYPTTPLMVQPTVACEGDPVIIQASTYNGSNVTFSWTTPTGIQTSNTPSLLLQPVTMADSGNYAVMVNVNGCNSLLSGTVELIVNPIPAMPAIFMNHDTLCEGDTLLLSTPNVPGANYFWSGPAGYGSSNHNPPAISGITSINNGVFELYLSFNGCRSVVAHDTVMVHARPASPTLFAANQVLCEGDPIVLSSNGSCDAHLWVGPQGFTNALLSNPSQNTSAPATTIAASDSAYVGGNWTAICVSAEGCYSAPSAPVSVTITPLPTPPSITNPGPRCEGNTLALSASSNVVGGTYTWFGPNGFTYQGQFPMIYNVTAAHAGAYGVVVAQNGCESDTAWTTVVVDPAPQMPTPTASGAVCAGGTLNLLANTTAVSYLWTGPAGFVSSLQNPSIPAINSNNAGYYHLTVVQNACSSDVGIVNIAVVENNITPVMTANGPLCEGDVLVLSAGPITGSTVQYVWSGPTSTDTTSTPSMIAPSATTNATGWYSLNVMIDGCPSPASIPVHVDVHATPATPAILSNGPVCAGDNIILATTTLADAYLWRGPNSFLSTQQQPSVITNAQNYHGGTYTLNVTTDGCTSADTSIMVQVNVPGAAPVLQSNSPVCLGDTIRITATTGADAYVWTLPNGTTNHTTNGLLLISPATLQDNGQFTVKGMYGSCATEASAAIDVVVTEGILENAFAGDDQLVCNGAGTATLTAGNPGTSGVWTTHSDALIVSPSHAQTLISHLESDVDYVFYWTLTESGCRSANADSVHITVAHSPLANPNGYALKDQQELVNASILLNDSLWLQTVNLSVVVDPIHGTYGTNPNHTINYVPSPDFVGSDSLMYQICLEACPEMCDMAWVQFDINPKIIVPDLITPNGDGVNDAFEMIGLETYYPQNQLMIFNRWGNEVFAAEDYQSNWKGSYNGGPVPDGTYYWVLVDRTNGAEILRGYLTIHR